MRTKNLVTVGSSNSYVAYSAPCHYIKTITPLLSITPLGRNFNGNKVSLKLNHLKMSCTNSAILFRCQWVNIVKSGLLLYLWLSKASLCKQIFCTWIPCPNDYSLKAKTVVFPNTKCYNVGLSYHVNVNGFANVNLNFFLNHHHHVR